MKYSVWLICLVSLCFSCKTPSKQENNSQSIQQKTNSKRFADVFLPWDGHWKGKFYVMSQPKGQLNKYARPQIRSVDDLQRLSLDTSMVIQVEQRYHSTSPYYQTVQITDTYLEQGIEKKVKSSGYNEVRGDSLFCVVNKPDETVVHLGSNPAESIIIWQRDIPGKIEYFYEQATEASYTIIGWGYYGTDDPTLAPKTYFYGAYQKQPSH